MYDSTNYRGIAFSSVIGKILDKVVLGRNEKVLSTSDFQFGYKSKHSTTQSSSVIEEVIKYYNTKGSSVYAMFLDASKAFHRVNYVKVFRLSIQKGTGMCPLESRFFFGNMCCNNECRIKWQKYLTETFKVTNRVKQGGVLSPVLFSVCIDELLLIYRNINMVVMLQILSWVRWHMLMTS